MKIIYWGKGARGESCLRALSEWGHDITLVVVQPAQGQELSGVARLANELGLPFIEPEDPNAREVAKQLEALEADLFILGGYGKILKQHIIDIPRIMCINLHAGKLPQYRGSSPLNWVLINGESEFTLSIIKVDKGVDTGDVLLDATFPISINDTIRDLHATANRQFPRMLVRVVEQIHQGTCQPRKQDGSQAAYYPLRFAEDGLVFWDMYSVEQIHNRIRALTEPYPCAFTFFRGQKVKLLSSDLYQGDFFGEPGRIYRISPRNGLLVCAKDRCLWVKEAVLFEDGTPLGEVVERYDKLATLSEAAMNTTLNTNPEGRQ